MTVPPKLSAEILSIGTELMLGEIVDTNAAFWPRNWHTSAFRSSGYRRSATIPTDCEMHSKQAISRSTLVLTSGGLGPTDDDMTREAIAVVLGEQPAVDPDLERSLRARFRGMNRDMPEKNVKQAWLIPSAEAMANPNGTAPGWLVKTDDGRTIAAMPGPPSEMRPMWRDGSAAA